MPSPADRCVSQRDHGGAKQSLARYAILTHTLVRVFKTRGFLDHSRTGRGRRCQLRVLQLSASGTCRDPALR